jgi:formamidopyrimidine-DNA glycosylase
MPEMPEVETMVRDLSSRVTGRTVAAVRAPFRGSVIYPDYEEFERRVSGQTIVSIGRRGKFALLSLSSGDLLIIHRGMTGSLLLRAADAPPEPHARLVFVLDNGEELRFTDPRKFGKIYVMDPTGAERVLPWEHFGPEPLNGDFTVASFRRSLRGRTAPIKPLLLGQRIVAGLGNIYVDEALFLARIHPERPAGSLTLPEIKRLYVAIRTVLASAIERRGTTFNNYTDIEGRSGAYQDALQVFHRGGEPCPRCGRPLTRTVLQGRGTHFCPKCQRA